VFETKCSAKQRHKKFAVVGGMLDASQFSEISEQPPISRRFQPALNIAAIFGVATSLFHVCRLPTMSPHLPVKARLREASHTATTLATQVGMVQTFFQLGTGPRWGGWCGTSGAGRTAALRHKRPFHNRSLRERGLVGTIVAFWNSGHILEIKNQNFDYS
jgi:cell wall-associated NlpC family hydrolase